MNTQAATVTIPNLLELACEIQASLCDHRSDLLRYCLRLSDVQVESGEMPS